MPTFSYLAQTLDGRKLKGEIDALDMTEAKNRLRQNRIVPLKLTQIKTSSSSKYRGGPTLLEVLLTPKIKSKDMLIFTRQFATLINSGIPVGDSLKILESGTGVPLLRTTVTQVRMSIEGGKSLGDSLRMHPMIFDNFYCNMVKAGETSGSLDGILNRMAIYLEKSEKIKSQVKGALTYPAMIIIVAIVVIGAILVFVIPKFQEMYSTNGSELPVMTEFIISMSKSIKEKWFLILMILATIPTVLLAYYKTEEGKRSIDQTFIGFPLFGDLIIKSSVARFTRTMATLLGAGVPLIESIEAAAKTVGNYVVEMTLFKCRESVSQGKGFAAPLARLKILPPMVSQMVGIGEQTGALDSMMGKVADFYEDEVENTIKAMTTLIEPLLLVVLGGIIALILIAMYLPIFGMADAVSRVGG